MEISSQPLIPASVRNRCMRLRPGVFWSIFMWTLGLVEWAEPTPTAKKGTVIVERTKLERRFMFISSIVFLVVLISTCVFTVTWYFLCLFGEREQFLRFSSFALFYWPIVTSAPVICLYAMLKKHSNRHYNPNLDLSWTNIFSETFFANRYLHLESQKSGCVPYRVCCLAFFFTFAAINSFMEIIYLIQRGPECQQWPKFVCLVANVLSLFFYATFCYFLYLNRAVVELESEKTMDFIESHATSEEACKMSVADFFTNYIRLRKLTFPWLNTVVFCTTFGMAIYFTLDYDHINLSAKNSTQQYYEYYESVKHQTIGSIILEDIGMVCGVPCFHNATGSDHNNLGFILFDVMILGEKMMVMTVALMVVGAMDILYVWDRFKMGLNLLPVDKIKNRDVFVQYVRFMHPDPTSATIASFIIPLLGIACGTLSGHRLEANAN